MPNPCKNKVVYNGTTLIDLTADTVTAADVAQGKTFHLPSGAPATGTATGGGVYQDEDGYIILGEGESDAPQGNISITANGTYDVAAYAGATVDVQDTRVKAIITRTDSIRMVWPSGRYSVGAYAFSGCRYMTFDPLPSGIPLYGTDAFADCTRLDWTSLPVGAFGGNGYVPNNCFLRCTNLALTSLPSDVTLINSGAFQGCTSLALTSLPSSVTKLYSSAFRDCTNLALTSLPSSLASIIDGYTFYNCPNITISVIPSGVTGISSYSFAGCTGITSISSDAALTTIGNGAFIGTSVNPTMTLTSARFPNYKNSNAFPGVFGSTTAAYACQLLEVADIGSVASIAANAFANCSSLKTLVLRRTANVSTLANVSAFLNTPLGTGGTGGTVYVPSALISSYQTATNWKTLYNDGTVTFAAIEGSEYER